MNSKYYLLIIMVIALSARLYLLRQSYFIGNDAYLHYSVMRQALNGGGLSHYSLGYGNPEILEPKGFYYITIIPAYLIGLRASFLLMPLLMGLLSIYLAYLLMKQLFNKRVGLITALLLTLSIGHIYRTSPNTYRGDSFFLTVMIASLYYFNKSLSGAKRYSIITGLLMALSALLWNGYPILVLLIISGLVINQTIKYVRGRYFISDLVKAFTTLVVYYLLELLFLLTGLIKPIFFTTNAALHSLITFTPLLMGVVYYLMRGVNKRLVIIILLIAGVIITSLNINVIKSMIMTGLLEHQYFYKVGVSELLPPTHSMLYTMLSVTLYAMWGGLVVLLIKKQTPSRLTYLVWVVMSLYLMLNYSRYNFIGSLTSTSLTALLTDYLMRRFNKAGIIILLIIMVPFINDFFNNINRVGPRMNPYWEEALSWLRENTNNSRVLTWWDHGSWVQYYTGYQTITDSVTGQAVDRIQRTARFLMSNASDDFSDWGVKYLIIGADDMLYSGAIISIAGINGTRISYLPRAEASNNGLVIRVSDGYFSISDDVRFVSRTGSVMMINKAIIQQLSNSVIINSGVNASDCVIITPFFNWYVNDVVCESNYVKLMYGNGINGYEKVYDNGFVRIYSILN